MVWFMGLFRAEACGSLDLHGGLSIRCSAWRGYNRLMPIDENRKREAFSAAWEAIGGVDQFSAYEVGILTAMAEGVMTERVDADVFAANQHLEGAGAQKISGETIVMFVMVFSHAYHGDDE